MSMGTFLALRDCRGHCRSRGTSFIPAAPDWPVSEGIEVGVKPARSCRGIFGALTDSLPSLTRTEEAWPRPSTNPRKIRRKPQPSATCSPAWTSRSASSGEVAARGARAERGRSRLHRQAHRGAGGAGAGAPPARHVYRRHRREGAASPVRRGDRQLDGRGAGRPRHLHRGRARRRRLRQRHRQRPRHPGRSASEVQEQVGARSDHVHAARRRQIRLRGLRDLGRPARRRRLGRQRAVRPHGGRGRARPEALQDGVRARQAEGQAAGRRQGAEPPRHQGALPSRPGDFRRRRRTSSPSACSR